MNPVVIIRHPKERVSKCSLQPLKGREGIRFLTAKPELQFDASNHILLAVDAPPLTEADGALDTPLLLLDSTWRLLPDVEKCVVGEPIRRSIPNAVKTAYPRVSKIETDPIGGLASVEALYLALKLMGSDDPTLLDDYYWKDLFLENMRSAGL